MIRYPVMLEKLLSVLDERLDLHIAKPTRSERLAVESRMVRYKFGPWDDNYYPIIGTLIGLGLIEKASGRGRIAVRSTRAGVELSTRLSNDENWSAIAARCRFAAQHFDMSGNQLKELIYANLPDVIDRPHRTLI
ncbi:hypothetical protein ITP53_09555 [Nonomuraea sp. K274]|uniref:Uncharacterized protein n=1 Tax=Nonomuraea cypriaca TaxID=1187855 RepID=A0A931A4D8_9ACTN|nr:hypothetical protein [Nonomuraea cypriaca]MBF8185986.1 hypothetical protein [Nonomuraea cypriaca]